MITMPVCCRCNASGRYVNCSCVKGGRLCVGCLPLRKGKCCNQGPTRTSPPPAVNSFGASLPLSPDTETASLFSCPCGRPDSVQPMIQCQGPGKEKFHLDCVGIDAPNLHMYNEWWCLQCSIQRNQHVKIVRHIPKGARIQVALALWMPAQWKGVVCYPGKSYSLLLYHSLLQHYYLHYQHPRVFLLRQSSRIKHPRSYLLSLSEE